MWGKGMEGVQWPEKGAELVSLAATGEGDPAPGSRGGGGKPGSELGRQELPAGTQPLVSTLHLPDPGPEVRFFVGLSRGLGRALRPRGNRAAQAH